MCYSIYLLHNSAIEFSCKLIRAYLPGRSFAVQMLIASAIALPSILIVCATYFRLIEKPCMRRDWPQRLWKRITGLMFVEDDGGGDDPVAKVPRGSATEPVVSTTERS